MRCASVGGSEQAVCSTSHLHEPTLSVWSCLRLDSEVSAELGEADISDDAESFGSPQVVMGDRETQGLSGRQPLQPTYTHYHSDTDHNLVKKVFFAAFAYAPLPTLFT